MPVTVEYDNTETQGDGSRRSRRRWIALAVIAVLVLLVLLLAWRGGKSPSGPAGPAGQNAAGLPRGPAIVGAGGTRNLYGVPVGYRRDRASAIEAAGNDAVAIGSLAMYDATFRRAINRTIYAPTARDKATTDQDIANNLKSYGLNSAGQVLDPKTGQVDTSKSFVSDCYPQYGAYRLSSAVTTDRVPVTIWMPCVQGASSNTDRSRLYGNWVRLTLTMRWIGGDWRIADVDGELGPWPAHRQVPNVAFSERAELLRDPGWTLFANATEELLPYPGAKLS